MPDSHFMKLVAQRYSLRRYDPAREVSEQDLLSMIEAARLAPSAGNSQPWRIVVVRDPELRQSLYRHGVGGFPNRFVRDAPIVIVLCADLKIHYTRLAERVRSLSYHQIDVAIAGEHLVLRAAELGIGTCWIGWFNARQVKKALALPDRFKVIALITVGYPKEGRSAAVRKRLSRCQIMRYDRWGT